MKNIRGMHVLALWGGLGGTLKGRYLVGVFNFCIVLLLKDCILSVLNNSIAKEKKNSYLLRNKISETTIISKQRFHLLIVK